MRDEHSNGEKNEQSDTVTGDTVTGDTPCHTLKSEVQKITPISLIGHYYYYCCFFFSVLPQPL